MSVGKLVGRLQRLEPLEQPRSVGVLKGLRLQLLELGVTSSCAKRNR